MNKVHDLIIIGGGINGTGIAADAVGRGLDVMLIEADDLASKTSSASSKLIHGGLRYLEYYEFDLVKQSLEEREVLLKIAPHIIFPMRFRLPYEPHLRDRLVIKAGLFLYDNLTDKRTLTQSKAIKFDSTSELSTQFTQGFEYSDCWVDDARLVVANAQAVTRDGGIVKTRSTVIAAKRLQDAWEVIAQNNLTKQHETFYAKGLVNAAGPFVNQIFSQVLNTPSPINIRHIRGSHIVIPKHYQGTHAFMLQNQDGRILFVIPWLEKYLMIGTTDVEHTSNLDSIEATEAEISYILDAYNHYFKQQIEHEDIIWQFSGVRPLIDDQSLDPKAITRDYKLVLDVQNQLPLISVFGGKLTTYRKLAEQAVNKLRPFYPKMQSCQSASKPLPGGDIKGSRYQYATELWQQYPWLGQDLAKRYAWTYGSNSELILKNKFKLSDLGDHFGANLFEAELNYLVEQEWARTLKDIIWRRTKLGLILTDEDKTKIVSYLNTRLTS